MNFFEELSWRGMIQDYTPEVDEILKKGGVTGYIGFDPTAPSLTIGNYVQIMLLRLFQLSGNKPIILMGGATGRIGDPSGKDAERQLKSEEELDRNLNHQLKQFEKFLDWDGPFAAEVVNNYDFYKDMNVLEFLRKVGKSLTVNYMMSKESVKKRIETGISFTEFSYQLLQAYDFVCLHEQKNCILQMGGSDQWGNITSGTELVRRHLGAKAFALTTPLLTRADGKKFGKSEEGNIWLDEQLTSPYKFYQFWINCADQDIPAFTRYFTLKSEQEVLADEAAYADDPRKLKALLAEELTRRIHSDEAFETVEQVSMLLFGKKGGKETLLSMNEKAFQMIAEEIPSFKVSKSIIEAGHSIVDVLADYSGVMSSKSEVRRAIKGNALSVNREKVTEEQQSVGIKDLFHGRYCMVENGKRNKYILVVD